MAKFEARYFSKRTNSGILTIYGCTRLARAKPRDIPHALGLELHDVGKSTYNQHRVPDTYGVLLCSETGPAQLGRRGAYACVTGPANRSRPPILRHDISVYPPQNIRAARYTTLATG